MFLHGLPSSSSVCSYLVSRARAVVFLHGLSLSSSLQLPAPTSFTDGECSGSGRCSKFYCRVAFGQCFITAAETLSRTAAFGSGDEDPVYLSVCFLPLAFNCSHCFSNRTRFLWWLNHFKTNKYAYLYVLLTGQRRVSLPDLNFCSV